MPLWKYPEGHFLFMTLIQFHQHAEISGANIRTEQLDGKEWLVAPCVAIVEGVLNGLLVPANEIEISTPSWNGRSIPVHHPDTNTANEPMTVQNQVIGYFYSAEFEQNKLQGEMWLDVAKANSLGGDAASVIGTIQNGGMVEVSTAYWAYTTSQAGEFNGVPYVGVTTHILPDHIALLPGDEGACNIDDGCGVPRANRRELMKYTIVQNGESVELELVDLERKPTCHIANIEGMSFRDVGKALRAAVDLTTQIATDHWVWIEDVYDDYFVYEIEAEGSEADGLWRRDYSISSDFVVTLGEASSVIRRTVYEDAPIPQMQNENILTKVKNYVSELFVNHDKENRMKDIIEAIIKNGKTEMTAEQLGELPETAVSVLFNGLQLNEEGDGDEPVSEPPTSEPASDDVPEWAATLVETVDDLSTKVDGLSTTQNVAIEQQKTAVIKRLLANERNTFSEDELKEFALPQLEKFVAAFIDPDYSGLFYGENDNGEYEYAPLTINIKKEGE